MRQGGRIQLQDSIVFAAYGVTANGKTSNECLEIESSVSLAAAAAGESTLVNSIIACEEPAKGTLANSDPLIDWVRGLNPSTNGGNYAFNTSNVVITDSANASVSVLAPLSLLHGDRVRRRDRHRVHDGARERAGRCRARRTTTGRPPGRSACARRMPTSRSGSLSESNHEALIPGWHGQGASRPGRGDRGRPRPAGGRAGGAATACAGGRIGQCDGLEEIVVVGRQRSAAEQVLQERIELSVVADLVGAEQISRVGDSTVSLALRRLPAVTVVDDQFIYVRGLGERYSSTTLNGAHVPSPDLTRNVIPLDLFPASIIDSLAIQKGYSPDMPAAFGGGNVDIRTRSLPDRFVADIEVGTGWNSDSTGRA